VTTLDPSHRPLRLEAPGHARAAVSALLAIAGRDLLVTRRELASFLVQTLVQPLFLLFVFGKVLTGIGTARPGFSVILLPGVVAFSLFLTPLQAMSIDLGRDLGFTREIEDRLLAPLPHLLVALEKVVLAALRGLISGALVFPLAYLVLGSGYQVRTDQLAVLAGLMVLTALLGASIGLLLGVVMPIAKLPLIFAVVITPLIFTGCTYYPWASLGGLRWFQVVTLFNPLTYASEGLRHAMVPALHGAALPTLDVGWVLLALCGSLAAFLAIGLRLFQRRVLS
jgi:ABC-2 type transport system permease protein